MRQRLLDCICCPSCGSVLQAIAFESDHESRIQSGLLLCSCGEQYPIIKCIPRLLLSQLQSQFFLLYREYFDKFGHRFESAPFSRAGLADRQKLRTQTSFGYEWTMFSKYDVDNFRLFIQPMGKEFFAGKFGLDVGCGAGRHVRQVTALGGEIIGVDISHAVDSAFQMNETCAVAHFVQGDVFNLPFQRNVFDFIYSLGVLHHLPDPKAGFLKLPPHLKPGAPIFIWVYYRTRRKELLEYVRKITSHLPHWMVNGLAWLAAIVDYGIGVNLYRLLRRFRFVAVRVPLRIEEYAQYNFYSSYTDWFDRLSAPTSNFYTEPEIRGWFEAAGLENIDTAVVGDSWVWGRGYRGGR